MDLWQQQLELINNQLAQAKNNLNSIKNKPKPSEDKISLLYEKLLDIPLPIESPCKHEFVFFEAQVRNGDEIENQSAICIRCGNSKNP